MILETGDSVKIKGTTKKLIIHSFAGGISPRAYYDCLYFDEKGRIRQIRLCEEVLDLWLG